MSHNEQTCGIVYCPGGKSRVTPGPIDPALLHIIDIAVLMVIACEDVLGVDRAILQQLIAIVNNQICIDSDILQSNLFGLQVDFGNQKSNCYE
ncbi:MAG: hypothetical protein J2P41_07055 [Blastocatellia bacterium]|nr:hypothetical protein [Blastocatellia bacterium]